MRLSRDFIFGSAVVSLGYLGEMLYSPLAGSIAAVFDRDAGAGYAFVSAAFYGAAISGLVILFCVRSHSLGRWMVCSLVLGSTLNLLALMAPSWGSALGLRLLAGMCFGTAVGAVVILMAQSASGTALARRFSTMFSLVFLNIAAAMAVAPHLAGAIGVEGLAVIHGLLCTAAAVWARAIGGTANRPESLPLRAVRGALTRIFWSRHKALAFSLHAANLFAALLILISIQPALSAKGVSDEEVGLALAALSGSTCLGGFVHAGLSRRLGLPTARWVLLAVEVGAVAVAAVLSGVGGQSGAFFAALALAAKGICGGPPSFEAMLYDLGPVDPPASGMQRSLGMIAAISATTLILGLADWLQLDTLSVVLLCLGLAYGWQLLAYARLCREPGRGTLAEHGDQPALVRLCRHHDHISQSHPQRRA